jgi:hypothetical protein
VWFVVDAIGEINLDAFYAAYRVDWRSRPAHDAAMMVALLLYAYARATRRSREIEPLPPVVQRSSDGLGAQSPSLVEPEIRLPAYGCARSARGLSVRRTDRHRCAGWCR